MYKPYYKCRNCGTIFVGLVDTCNISYTLSTGLVQREILQLKSVLSDIPFSLKCLHNCKNGDISIGDFVCFSEHTKNKKVELLEKQIQTLEQVDKKYNWVIKNYDNALYYLENEPVLYETNLDMCYKSLDDLPYILPLDKYKITDLIDILKKEIENEQ